MSDIFNEIDDDLRRDRFRKVWDRVGVYVIAVAVLIVVGVAGWRGYDYWRTVQAEAAGDAYYAAVKLAEAGDAKGAAEALEALAKKGPAGYTMIGNLRAAAIAAGTDTGEGVKAYEVAARVPGMPRVLADLALIEAAYLAVDIEEMPALAQRLSGFLTNSNPFRHSAREILALGAAKAGDWVAAQKYIEALQGDAELPQSFERRVELLAAVARSSAPRKTEEAAKAP